MKEIITKDTNIAEMISQHPETRHFLMELGLGCIGCVASSFETIEEGLQAHNIDVEEALKKINEIIK
ncbi:MAG TPA: DUF1858 domain-containing protein [bacterium]|nr:DUF1858 domain-containing protein [bacterium]